MKYIYFLVIAFFMVFRFPSYSNAETSMEIVNNDIQDVTISVSESVVRVVGANGMFLSVYNLAGVRVMSIKVEGSDKRYDLNLPKGCYIVKVGKVVRKISIR